MSISSHEHVDIPSDDVATEPPHGAEEPLRIVNEAEAGVHGEERVEGESLAAVVQEPILERKGMRLAAEARVVGEVGAGEEDTDEGEGGERVALVEHGV